MNIRTVSATAPKYHPWLPARGLSRATAMSHQRPNESLVVCSTALAFYRQKESGQKMGDQRSRTHRQNVHLAER